MKQLYLYLSHSAANKKMISHPIRAQYFRCDVVILKNIHIHTTDSERTVEISRCCSAEGTLGGGGQGREKKGRTDLGEEESSRMRGMVDGVGRREGGGAL